jgi:hypothetical protein
MSSNVARRVESRYVRLVDRTERPDAEPLEQGVLRRGVAARDDIRPVAHRRRRLRGTLVAEARPGGLWRGDDAGSPWLARPILGQRSSARLASWGANTARVSHAARA